MIDTSVYIDHLRNGLQIAWLYEEFVVRHSGVVLSELRRGARSKQERDRRDFAPLSTSLPLSVLWL